ncbi:hypothetical protein [Allorhizocola rhizosphaerae]|uniref:hypothetical protein n=1 Tax=Allorhizocola rhizosphaerae TaxID=1872709 RepID=UPI0013C2EDED|nr:hypothetical protein [Allorhizocola rhizosphaerae]
MNRMLLASLAIVSTAVAPLTVPAPAIAADPECRYVMPPAPPPPIQFDDQLVQIGPIGGRNEGTTRSLGVQQPHWSVMAIRPLAGADYDLLVYDCPDERVVGASFQEAGLVDFVALDGNRAWSSTTTEKQLYAKMFRKRSSVHGTFNAEYSTGGKPLATGTSQTLALRGTPAVVRDVFVAAGTTATIRLGVLSGSADLFLVDSSADKTTWGRTRAQAVASSANPGSADESIVISVPAGVPSRTYGLVIVNNADYGEYYLVRS